MSKKDIRYIGHKGYRYRYIEKKDIDIDIEQKRYRYIKMTGMNPALSVIILNVNGLNTPKGRY